MVEDDSSSVRAADRPSPTIVLILSCGLVLAGPRPVAFAETQGATAAANTDALYEKVFKQKRQAKTQQLDLPVRFDGQELGLVAARLPADPTQAVLKMEALADLLAGKIQQPVIDAVRAGAGPDGFGKPGDIPESQLKITVDPNQLQVVVDVPPENRERQTLDVMGRARQAQAYIRVPNADVAAYTNIRASMEYLKRPDGSTLRDGRQPANVVFESALNIGGWVLEADAFYHEGGPRRWGRGGMRLLHDFVDSRVRAQVGDINYPVASVQAGRQLGGITVSRNFSLQPYRTSQPSGLRDFVLEAPSVVEVLVNGRPARSFRLQPGPYSLSDFPGTSGTNDIQVRISDVYGRERVIEFPFFFDNDLLETGLHDFSYTFGYPTTVSQDRYSYDTSRPTMSMYHRVGVTDELTLGVNAQADHSQQVYGTEIVFASPLGTVALEPAMSRNGGILGSQVTLRYRDYRNGESIWQQRTITAQATWRDNAFAQLGTQTPRNTVSYDVSARVSQPLTQSLVATVSGRYQKARDPSLGNGHSIDLSLRQRLGRRGSIDLTMTHGRDTSGEMDIGVYLSLRLNFYEGRLSTGASIDTSERERRFDLRYSDVNPVDSLNVMMDLTDRAGNDSADATLSYTHQRFESSVRHDVLRRQDDDKSWSLENRTVANIATALAFADGHVAISRPITNSFAIVVPHRRLKGRMVGVDPINGTYLSHSDWLGPPVVPNVSAYFSRPLLLAVPDAPATYDIGNDRPTVQPEYRTGALVPIGTDATVSLSGGFLMADGSPAALLSGELRPVDDPSHKAVQFFTNRKGRFRVESVRPGKWQILLFGHEQDIYPVEISPEAEGVVDIGSMSVAAKP